MTRNDSKRIEMKWIDEDDFLVYVISMIKPPVAVFYSAKEGFLFYCLFYRIQFKRRKKTDMLLQARSVVCITVDGSVFQI